MTTEGKTDCAPTEIEVLLTPQDHARILRLCEERNRLKKYSRSTDAYRRGAPSALMYGLQGELAVTRYLEFQGLPCDWNPEAKPGGDGGIDIMCRGVPLDVKTGMGFTRRLDGNGNFYDAKAKVYVLCRIDGPGNVHIRGWWFTGETDRMSPSPRFEGTVNLLPPPDDKLKPMKDLVDLLNSKRNGEDFTKAVKSLRYPGSKSRLWKRIYELMPIELTQGGILMPQGSRYVEPFFGSGVIGLNLLRDMPRMHVVIGEKDLWLCYYWVTVRDAPQELIALIRGTDLTPANWELYRQQDGDPMVDIPTAAFRKLAIQQGSFGGLGVKAGSPIGGIAQNNPEYHIHSRYNKARLIERVWKAHAVLKQHQTEIFHGDFEEILRKYNSPNTFFYLDPPYILKGQMCYKHWFTTEDHRRFADVVRTLSGKWWMSYDNHPLVRELYRDYHIASLEKLDTIGGIRKNHELLVRNYVPR